MTFHISSESRVCPKQFGYKKKQGNMAVIARLLQPSHGVNLLA